MVVDVTLSRGTGATGKPRLQTYDAHRRAVETLVAALKDYRNWYLDLSNERNIRDSRFSNFDDLWKLRAVVRGLDPRRLVTASHAGELTSDELCGYLVYAGLDFFAVHQPRHAKSAAETAAKVQEYLTWMRELDRPAPVHLQEPFRRGYSRDWAPTAADFAADLKAARAGGAAGWCFHNGDQRDRPDKRPQRSFDLSRKRLFEQFDQEEQKFLSELRSGGDTPAQKSAADDTPFQPKTRVAIAEGRWRINGEVTCRGAKAEGLLMNVRMVNAVFEDRKRPDFDPEANTARFLAQVPDYAAHGVRAFTICLQGGFPGYEGAVNSAFNPDGSLREAYMRRVRRVIETCDRQGVAIILGCYYQRQDQILKNEDAVRAGVVNAVRWIQRCGFTNVVLEIANEFPHGGFDHRILKSPEGEAELIRLAKKTAPGLLVSTSGIGDGRLPDAVAEASDFLLIHFNGVHVEQIPERIAALKRFRKPIVCNEDDKIGEEAAKACVLSVTSGASWGFMHMHVNQYHPFKFDGAADDPVVYAKLKEVASP
jgi:hypothetical protein